MIHSKKDLIFIVIFILIALPIFSQEAPKKPLKINEETINQICSDAINKYFSEEKPKLLEEHKKLVEEAVKSAQEENKKTLEELEKRIIETVDKNIDEKAKIISEERFKDGITEYDKQRKEEERLKATNGPGFVYDNDMVFKFTFETLIRGEITDNLTDYNTSEDDSEMKILQRSIFGGRVEYKDRLSATFKLRHTQIWGDQNLNIFIDSKTTSMKIPSDVIYRSLYKENHGLGTYEAFIEIGNFRSVPLSLKAGIIQLHFGDGRFIGSNKDWFIESEPSTSAILKYQYQGHTFNIIYSKIRESEILRINNKLYNTPGDDLIGLYYSTRISDDITLDGYGFYNRVGPDPLSSSGEDINIGTLGLRTDSIFHKLKLNGEIIFQFGNNRGRDHIAGAADIDLKYHLPTNMSPYLLGGFAYATGDSGSKDKSLQFLQFYGSNEFRYGIIHQTALSNIILPRIGAGFYPLSRLNVALNYYYFVLASSKGIVYNARNQLSLYDPKGENGRNFGWETDLIVKFIYNKYLTTSIGYAISQPLDYQINQPSYLNKDAQGNPIILGNDFIHYAFGMINLNF